ncbi:MAG: ParA family protein [Syntrophales bacterium]|nr:ParA family protein [Syntrophales bacterium]
MVLSVANPKGGVGKTTIAVNLAYAMLLDYKDVMILDLDLQRSASLWAKLREQNLIIPIPVLTTNNVKEISGLCNLYKGNSGLLVVDCAGLDSDYNREVLSMSDVVVIPVRPSQIEVFGLNRFMSVLNTIKKTGHVLINCAYTTSVKKIENLFEFVDNINGLKQLKTVIRYRVDYQDSYASGKSVIEHNKGSQAAKEMHKLRHELREVLKEATK